MISTRSSKTLKQIENLFLFLHVFSLELCHYDSAQLVQVVDLEMFSNKYISHFDGIFEFGEPGINANNCLCKEEYYDHIIIIVVLL